MTESIEGEYLPHEYDERKMSDTEILDYTQGLRHKLVQDITREGPPIDKDERIMMLDTLRDMDRTSLGRMRIGVEEAGLENDRAAQEIVKQLAALNPNGLRREIPVDVPEPIIDTTEIDKIAVDQGVLHQGLENETSTQFLERMDKEHGIE